MNIMDRLASKKQKNEAIENARRAIENASSNWLRENVAALSSEASAAATTIAFNNSHHLYGRYEISVGTANALNFAATIPQVHLPPEIVISSSTPPSDQRSMIWLNADSREMFVYFDGEPGEWVSIRSIAARIFDLERAVERLGGRLF